MTVQEVLDHFGGKANTARALDISYQSVDQWEAKDSIPEGRQFEIQLMTNGALVAEKRRTA